MKAQQGALKLQGTHGNFTFVKTADGFLWKEKMQISKERLANDEAYAPQRDQMAEFARAGKAVKLLREAFKDQVLHAKDRRLTPRMQQLMVKVVKADFDPTHGRGQRTVQDGDLGLLEQFQFNKNAHLNDVLPADYTAAIDRTTGELRLDLPAFLISKLVHPPRATDFRITLAGSEVDFAAGKFQSAAADSGMLPLTNGTQAPIALSCTLTPNSDLPIFLAAGIEFIEVVNGFEYPIVGGVSNALCLVKVDFE